MGKFAQFNDPAGQSTNLKCHTTGQFPCLDGEVTERFGLAQQNLALVCSWADSAASVNLPESTSPETSFALQVPQEPLRQL
ncbi:MAG: hypothetical protein Ct9H300mP16_14690 [Pseudomonadota bacterium]|nr:MAG: hypothetical protein Ct9H300mP16_14690 [Pseudomonadota bacterium]